MKAIVGDKLEIAFVLALSTGMRIGEILALRWKDVDLKEGVIRVSQSLKQDKNTRPEKQEKDRALLPGNKNQER